MKIRFRVWDGRKMWCPPKKEDYTWRIARTGILWRCTAFYDETTLSKYLSAITLASTLLSETYSQLKEKEGKEIFEGDIIQGIVDEQVIQGKVFWDEERITWCVSGYISYELRLVCDKRILGNVYENPEIAE